MSSCSLSVALAGVVVMSKTCKFNNSKRCYHSSCSFFDPVSGMVVLCRLFRGGLRFTPRKVASSLDGVV